MSATTASDSKTAYFTIESSLYGEQQVTIRPKQTSLSKVPVFIIGRDPRCHLALSDVGVSPVHALVARNQQGEYIIKARTPSDIFYVNGEPTTHKKLTPGCTLRIGYHTLHFQTTRDTFLSDSGFVLDEPAGPQRLNDSYKVIRPQRNTSIGERLTGMIGAGFYWAALACLVGFFGLFVVSALSDRASGGGGGSVYGADQQFTSAQGTATVLYFYADWCSACRQQRPVIEQIRNAYSSNTAVEWINVDHAGNRNLAARYGVRSIPRTVILNSRGETVRTFYGTAGYNQISSAVTDALTMQ